MGKTKQEQTPEHTKQTRKERNLLAAARSRKKKEDALKAAQDENASLKLTNSMLMENLFLLKDKLFHTDEKFKENKKMKKMIRQMKKRIEELSKIILNNFQVATSRLKLDISL